MDTQSSTSLAESTHKSAMKKSISSVKGGSKEQKHASKAEEKEEEADKGASDIMQAMAGSIESKITEM